MVQPEPVVPTVPTPTAPASAPVAAAPLGMDAASVRLERIKKIKSDINGRVGNPVNLVDIDNTLGREYMSALLEAMKLLSTASEAESAAAMGRLENVYAQVMNRLNTAAPQATPVAVAPVSPTPVDAVPPVTINPSVPPVAPPPVVRTLPVQSAEFQTAPTTQAAPLVSTNLPTPSPIPQTPPPPANLEPHLTPEEVRAAEAAWAASDAEPIAAPVTVPASIPVSATPSVAGGVPGVAPLMSVAATAAPLRTPADLPAADSIQSASIAGDPRYTKEVDDGLNQLLSEWTLFKKSGLFGTGPKGREHPLFLKIANLQIPIILSGRFEGSTQEIKQSITDYMNGWRYEQGIIYDQGETFEQYLRRVIRHIIDLQNKRRAS
jgi:hypothetical protein